jgi:hypothetical protein
MAHSGITVLETGDPRSLLDRLIDFFNRLPQVVRGETALVIAALSGHEFIDLVAAISIWNTFARGLFEAPCDWGALAT